MTTSLKRSLTTAGAAVLALALAACGAGESGGTTSSAPAPSSSGASSSAAATPAEAAEAIIAPLRSTIAWPEAAALSAPVDVKGKTIWWVPIGDAVPVIHGFYEGFNQAVTAAGGTVKLCDGKFNPADIGNCLKQAGEQKADAVVTAFIDYMMLPAAFDGLTAAGVPVLIAGVPPTGDKAVSDTFAFFDPSGQVNKMYETTSAAGIVAAGDSPNGLWLRLLDSSLTTGASDAGVASWKTLCPDCALATLDFTTANVDKLASAVSAALVQNPDVNVVMVPVDSFVPPVTQALKTAGKNDVKVVSTGGDVPNMQNVAAGTQAGDLGTPVIYSGWSYANALFQLLAGDEVTGSDILVNRFFDSSNIGDLEITPEAYLSDAWYGDSSYQDGFKAAWGLS